MRYIVVLATLLLAVTLCAQGGGENASPATKQGWWIHIDTAKTQASTIHFLIGTSQKDRREFRTWHSGEPNDFDVPNDFQNVQSLYLYGVVSPNDKNAWLCMMFKKNGVKHMDFDNDEDQTKNQSDHDGECEPFQ